jgi:hypothetical protein
LNLVPSDGSAPADDLSAASDSSLRTSTTFDHLAELSMCSPGAREHVLSRLLKLLQPDSEEEEGKGKEGAS